MAETSLSADLLIERFGGIRPMAAKTGIAVTTVQGWKKRGMIPENRITQIVEAARIHGIDLANLEAQSPIESANDSIRTISISAPEGDDESSGSVGGDAEIAPALEKLRELLASEAETIGSEPASSSPVVSVPTGGKGPRSGRGGAGAAWVALMMLASAVLVGLLAMGPGVKRLMIQEQRLVALERELHQTRDQIRSLQAQNAMLSGVVPESVKKQISALSERAQTIEETVRDIGYETRALTEGVMGENVGTIEQRLSRIEGEIVREPAFDPKQQMMVFLAKLQQWQSTPEGQATFDRAIDQMLSVAQGEVDSARIEQKVRDAFKTSPELRQTFADLASLELRRGMAVVTVTSLRRKLTEGAGSFGAELSLISTLMPELVSSVNDIKPWSDKGVDSLSDLTDSFSKVAAGVVSETLNDSKMSFSDRLRTRFHDAFRIEYRGESLTGTPTQRILDKARRDLSGGNVMAAIETLQAVDGTSARLLSAWVDEAEGYVRAARLVDLATKTISTQLSLQPFMDQILSMKNTPLRPEDVTRGVVQSLSTDDGSAAGGY